MTQKRNSVLLVEDDEGALFGYERYLAKAGFETASAGSLHDARETLSSRSVDAIILDLKLPDGNSLEWIPEVKSQHPDVPVMVITGMSDVPTAVTAIKNGAENFLTKPLQMKDLETTLRKSLEIKSLRRRDYVQKRLSERGEPYFGTSRAITQLIDYSHVATANDTVVLLQGETGTGKGVLARWIHDRSERRSEPFVNLNCSSLKGDLLRSELFGHAKGAFTSAVKDREGLVEVADGGTLFLDEIGDMDLDVQAQLLTTIEEKSYRRVGENKIRTSDFRLLCASNKDLAKATEDGSFRRDLYYRICVFPIRVPPLRERLEDIAPLADHLLLEFGYQKLPLSEEVMRVLKGYGWPGNVRELRNMLERALLLSGGGKLMPHHFPGLTSDVSGAETVMPEDTLSLEEMERRHIARVLEKYEGDKNGAAKALGISLSALYRRLYKFAPQEETAS